MYRTKQEIPPNQAVLQRGIEACKRGELDTAARDLETVVLVEPKNAEALTWFGYVLLRQNKPEQAIPYLERALVLRPDDPDTATNLGNALLMKPNRTADDTRRAVVLFEKVSQRAPNSAEAQYNYGYALTRVGQFERAVVAYRRAVSLAPKNGLAWTNLGYALLKLGKNREAAQALKNGVTYAPQDTNTWIMLGTVETANGNTKEATTALENARKLDPKNPTVLMALGRAYTSGRRYVEAAEAFGAAADIAEAQTEGKKDTAPRYNQGVTLAQWGKLADALTAFEKVLAVDPQHYDALVNSGYVLFRQKKFDAAVLRFKDAIKVNNKATLAWTNLAATCEAQQNWEAAIFAWRRALALDPKQYNWWQYLAADFLRLKRYNEAAAAYGEMGKLWPALAEPLVEVGRVNELRAEGETDPAKKQAFLAQARTAYDTALIREPANVPAREGVERLRVTTPPPAPATAPTSPSPSAPGPQPKPAATPRPPIKPAPVNPAPTRNGVGGADL